MFLEAFAGAVVFTTAVSFTEKASAFPAPGPGAAPIFAQAGSFFLPFPERSSQFPFPSHSPRLPLHSSPAERPARGRRLDSGAILLVGNDSEIINAGNYTSNDSQSEHSDKKCDWLKLHLD